MRSMYIIYRYVLLYIIIISIDVVQDHLLLRSNPSANTLRPNFLLNTRNKHFPLLRRFKKAILLIQEI